MKRKIAFFITLIYFSILSASAQIVNPVKWTSSIEMTDGVHGTIVLSAKINSGWHMYSHDADPDIGPTPLSIQWDKLDGVKLDGDFKADKAVHTEFDELFGANLELVDRKRSPAPALHRHSGQICNRGNDTLLGLQQ